MLLLYPIIGGGAEPAVLVLDSREMDTGLYYLPLREHYGDPQELSFAGLRGFLSTQPPQQSGPLSPASACRWTSRIVALGDQAMHAAASHCPERPLLAILDDRDRAEPERLADANRIMLVQPPRQLLDLIGALQPQARRLIAIVPGSMHAWYDSLRSAAEARGWSVEALYADAAVQAHQQLARALLARPYDAVILPPGGDLITADVLRTLYVIAARYSLLLYGGLPADITRGGVVATVSLSAQQILQAIAADINETPPTQQQPFTELRADQPVFNPNLFRLRFPGRSVPALLGLEPWPP